MGKLINFELMVAINAWITGVKIAAAYDILRIFRCIVKHGKIWMYAEDFIFANVSGVIVFAMVYTCNDGSVRGFFIGLVIMGLFMYYRLVGKHVIKCVKKFRKTLGKVLKKHKKIDKIIS